MKEKIRIAHIINPFNAPSDHPSNLAYAQPITFRSMIEAKNNIKNKKISVELCTTQYESDRRVIPKEFKILTNLNRSCQDIFAFKKKDKRLPILKDILYKVNNSTYADIFIYTNADIAVNKNFYEYIFNKVKKGYDGICIHRGDIINYKGKSLEELYKEPKEFHTGHDCLVFTRRVLHKLNLGNIFLGFPPVGTVLRNQVRKGSKKFLELDTGSNLTFHLGKDAQWKAGKNRFHIFNMKEAKRKAGDIHKYVLLTTLYNETSTERIAEYLKALNHNINNPYIVDIVIFYEGSKRDNMAKILFNYNIKMVYISKRPTYNDMFTYANDHLPNNRIIITNADIYYDYVQGLNLLKDVRLKNKFIVLTRYNKINQLANHRNHKGIIIDHKRYGKIKTMHNNGLSIDTWIFKTPIKADFKSDIRIGIVKCDSRLNYHLLKSKRYTVYNPCIDILSIHEHNDWDPSKYNMVESKDGIKMPIKEWDKLCIKNGCRFKGVKFCKVKNIL